MHGSKYGFDIDTMAVLSRATLRSYMHSRPLMYEPNFLYLAFLINCRTSRSQRNEGTRDHLLPRTGEEVTGKDALCLLLLCLFIVICV